MKADGAIDLGVERIITGRERQNAVGARDDAIVGGQQPPVVLFENAWRQRAQGRAFDRRSVLRRNHPSFCSRRRRDQHAAASRISTWLCFTTTQK